MLFVDIDALKAINDELGHLAGDAAIVEAAHLLTEVFRTPDVIGRYGGDEFCVLAMTNTPESTELLESRLESALADHTTEGDARFVLSVTIGAEHIGEHSLTTVSEMIASADRVMYAKRRMRAT